MPHGALGNRLRLLLAQSSAARLAAASLANRVWASAFAPRYLLATNLSLCISISCLGDTLQQWVKRSRDVVHSDHDYNRTRNMSLAAISTGFLCHHWYLYLDRFLPGRGFAVVAKKVVLDQMFSPVLWVVYFSWLAYLDRSGLAQLQDRLTEKGGRLYLAEWIIWPPAQVINFYLLPTKYRMLYNSVISLGFEWYTSYLINDSDGDTNKLEVEIRANACAEAVLPLSAL